MRPEDIVDLTGRCAIGGLTVPPATADIPPPGAAVADLLLEPGDDPDDAEPRVHPGAIEPAEAAALAAAALARALPRDPLHLARTGVALRSIAREANLYPATLPSMAPGIAATARRLGRTVAVGHVERFNPAWRMAVERAGRVVAAGPRETVLTSRTLSTAFGSRLALRRTAAGLRLTER
jgi:hypothetical protein